MLRIATDGGRTLRTRCAGQVTPELGNTVTISAGGHVVAWPAGTGDADTGDADDTAPPPTPAQAPSLSRPASGDGR